jgi:glucokinase
LKEVFLGIDMGGTRIKMALLDQHGEIVRATILDAKAHMSMEYRLEELVADINQLKRADYVLKGIGIAFPGIIDFKNKQIISRYVKYPNAHTADICGWAEKHWQVPLLIENDARAALVGEWQHGAGKGYNNLLMVTLGTGMGSAVLLEGHLLRGRNYLAGNLGGHMSIDFEGEFCNCGNKGCVETAGSTWALSKNLEKIPDYQDSSLFKAKDLSFKNIFTAAAQGDTTAEALKLKSMEAWSAAIINLLHAYDPDKLILGGGIMESKAEIIPFIEKRIRERSWLPETGIQITAAVQTKYAGLQGMWQLFKMEHTSFN